MLNTKFSLFCVVTGDANFSMKHTSLTDGGFTQPSVAKQLFEREASADKGLTQCFPRIFPEPSFSDYATLEPVDKNFYNDTGKLYFFLIFGCPDKSRAV